MKQCMCEQPGMRCERHPETWIDERTDVPMALKCPGGPSNDLNTPPGHLNGIDT